MNTITSCTKEQLTSMNDQFNKSQITQAQSSESKSEFNQCSLDSKIGHNSFNNSSYTTQELQNISCSQKFFTQVKQEKLSHYLSFENQEYKFNSPDIIFDPEDSMTPRNSIERQFSLNLTVFQEHKDSQELGKFQYLHDENQVPFGGFDDHNHTSPFDHYDFQWVSSEFSMLHLPDKKIQDFNPLDNFDFMIQSSHNNTQNSYFESKAQEDQQSLPLLKVICAKQLSSLDELTTNILNLDSNLDTTADKFNSQEMSSISTRKKLKMIHDRSQNTQKNNSESSMLRQHQQPNRFEKTLDQTLILETEFKKSVAWSKSKMQQLASMLSLTVSQVYKWNWDRRQSNSYHYYKLCSAPVKPSKKLFHVQKVREQLSDSQKSLFQVSRQ